MSRRLLPKPSFTAASLVDEKRVTKPLDRRAKRNCVATACMPCRKRRSKCDGQIPCAACLANDKSECFYDKESDGRRSGTLKKHVNELSSDNSNLRCILGTLQSSSEEYVRNIIYRLRAKEDIEAIAKFIKENPPEIDKEPAPQKPDAGPWDRVLGVGVETNLSGAGRSQRGSSRSTDIESSSGYIGSFGSPEFENWPAHDTHASTPSSSASPSFGNVDTESNIRSWTTVTNDVEFIQHLLELYFAYQHSCFPVFSRRKFLEDLINRRPRFCSDLLLNSVLAVGCAFSDRPEARTNPQDSATAGNQFVAEVERLLDQEEGDSKITTIQALAIMSMRECGYLRDVKGWMYGSVALRAASETLHRSSHVIAEKPDDPELEVWRITYWGLFCLDLSWSLAIARLPQLSGKSWPLPRINYESETEDFSEYTDLEVNWLSTGKSVQTHDTFLQFIKLSEIIKNITHAFYGPTNPTEKVTPKKLLEFHKSLCTWESELPDELRLRPANNASHSFHMHMCLRATVIMLFRPFQKIQVGGSSVNSPKSICRKAAKEIISIAYKYRLELGLRNHILTVSHYIFLASQTLLLNLPTETEDLNRGLRLLTETKKIWPAGGLGLFAIPMIAQKWEIDLTKETHVISRLTEKEYSEMASTAWASAREEEVKVVTSEFIEYWEKEFADM